MPENPSLESVPSPKPADAPVPFYLVPMADRPPCSVPQKHRLVRSFQGNSTRRLLLCGDCGWPRQKGKDPRIGSVSQELTNLGYCFRCQTTWDFVDSHTTFYRKDEGMFPLCELCWRELSPAERLPFYRILFVEWQHSAENYGSPISTNWEDIERAVLSESDAAA